MNKLKVIDHNGAPVVDSREVAEMVGKEHKHLLRDIRGYIDAMSKSTGPNFGPSDFFIESNYKDSTRRELPCYLLTKKGCDMVANKMTGEKGVLFTAAYVTAFERMRERIERGKALLRTAETDNAVLERAANKRATAMLLNAKNRTAAFLRDLYTQAGVKPEYQALALSDFYSVDGVALPRIALQGTKVTYDKGTIAEMLGVYSKASGGKRPHAQAIGAIIPLLDISDEEREAVPYSRNGHDGTDYQYTQIVVDKLRCWFEEHGWPDTINSGRQKVRRDLPKVRKHTEKIMNGGDETMTRKQVRMRRVRWLLTVLVGAVCAWNAGALIVQNAIHGWQQFPQLAAALAGAWIAAELANELSPDGRRKPRW